MRDKKWKEEEQEMRKQWVFVCLGMIMAVIAGFAINAGYEWLKEFYSIKYIFLTSAVMLLVFIDLISFMFATWKESITEPGGFNQFLRRYRKSVFLRLRK